MIILLASIPGKMQAYSQHSFTAELAKNHDQKGPSTDGEEIVLVENTVMRIFAGFYSIQDDRFKMIYEDQACIYGFGVSQKIFSSHKHYLSLSIDFKFFSKKGESTVTQEATKLILKPISMGVVYMFVTKPVIPCAEVGWDYLPYKEKSLVHSTSGRAWGFHLQGGILIPVKVLKFTKVKLYLRYSSARTEENNLEVNLGGIEYGLGIVYGFNLF